MSEGEYKNAAIRAAQIRIERGFILTIMVDLDYGGAGQGFGGYMLSHTERDPHIALSVWIVGLMKTFKVSSWDDLKGKPCRAYASHGKVEKIGHFLEPLWFNPEELSYD